MKILTIIFTVLLFSTSAFNQSGEIPIITAEDLMDAFHEEAANRIEEALQEEEEGIDSVAWVNPEDWAGWDESFRTSDWDAVVTDYPEGRRIGCICMDGTPQEDKGRGACGGRGGVRFWLYQQADSIFLDPTQRHYSHPQPLSEEEKQNLAAYNESPPPTYGARGNDPFSHDFANIVMVMMVCITIGYVAKMYFAHSAEL